MLEIKRGGTRHYLENIELHLPEDFSKQEKLADEIEQRLLAVINMRAAAERQFEAIDALHSSTLRDFFHFEANLHA